MAVPSRRLSRLVVLLVMPTICASQITLTKYTVPTPGSRPSGIATGADGALWFVENAGNKIGRITTAGAFSEFPIPTTASLSYGIVAGPDGDLWFTEMGTNKIARIT